MKYKKVFIPVVIIGIIVGIFYFTSFSSKKEQLLNQYLKPVSYKNNIKISLGDKIPSVEDYSDEFDSITWLYDDDMNKKVGTYQGIANSKYHLHIITLEVVDNNPPVFKTIKDITIYEGDNIKLEDKVSVEDDSNEEVNVVVKGEYSLEKSGTYPLTYEATDKSGNKATADFKLIVKKKSENIIPTVTSKGYDIVYKDGAYYIKNILVANKTYALSKDYNPKDLTKETKNAYNKMRKDALKDGVNLRIISGFRSYSMQRDLYNSYVNKDGKSLADTYSARPGHSEHQSGLAFDVNSLKISFKDTKEGIWLNKNCYKYGFILRYPKGKESITGYIYEPWHFRYIGDEAKNLYNNGNWITLEEYLGIKSKYAS